MGLPQGGHSGVDPHSPSEEFGCRGHHPYGRQLRQGGSPFRGPASQTTAAPCPAALGRPHRLSSGCRTTSQGHSCAASSMLAGAQGIPANMPIAAGSMVPIQGKTAPSASGELRRAHLHPRRQAHLSWSGHFHPYI